MDKDLNKHWQEYAKSSLIELSHLIASEEKLDQHEFDFCYRTVILCLNYFKDMREQNG